MACPVENFSYSDESLIFVTPGTENRKGCETVMSKFDSKLQEKWNFASRNGCMRYQLDELRSRCLDGKYHFVCHVNENRITKKRTPQTVTCIDMPFNPDDFNFNKVAAQEVLLRMMPSWAKREEEHLILVNASPLDNGSSLLVPSVRENFPQVLKEGGLRLLLEIMLLSGNPALRAGFNSLTALASVNHFHFHIYYFMNKQYLETAKVRKLHSNCFELMDYPAPAFVFQITKLEDIGEVTRSVMCLVNYFLRQSMAHTMYVTRGAKFEDSAAGDYKALRVYLWAREAYIKQKDFRPQLPIPACLELSGFIPVKDNELLDTICEETVVELLERTCRSHFDRIKEEIINIL